VSAPSDLPRDPRPGRPRRVRAAIRRNSGPAALVISVVALGSSLTGVADAARQAIANVVKSPRPGAVLRLDQKGKFPAKAIPKVSQARTADKLGTLSPDDVKLACSADTVDLGTWCIDSRPYPMPTTDLGKNDFFYATQACVAAGGFLPSAAQLIGAAPRIKLNSYLSDSQLTASVDVDPADGLSDKREMSSTLITTQGGASSAGLLGVSEGSTGNPKVAEPNPNVIPAVPAPDTLQYVTVVDNGEKGGFAGSKPIGQPEAFRCGHLKAQGASQVAEE
jgi:hypothetical protein